MTVNVIHVASTNIYDDAATATASDALTIMENTYAASTWHYTDANGNQPDLHHGILYKDVGGGEHEIIERYSQ